MRRDQEAGRFLPIDFPDQVHHLGGRFPVEVARRLVGQDQFGPVHQGAGNCDPLLLSARKLGGQKIHAATKADAVQQFASARPRRRRFAPRFHRSGEDDVLQSREIGLQVMELEDEADMAVAKLGEVSIVCPGQILVQHEVLPR